MILVIYDNNIFMIIIIRIIFEESDDKERRPCGPGESHPEGGRRFRTEGFEGTFVEPGKQRGYNWVIWLRYICINMKHIVIYIYILWIEYRGKVILWHLQAMYHFHEAIPITTKFHWRMLLDSDSKIGSRPFSGSVAGGSCFSHSYCAGRILGEDILALVCGYTFHLIPFWPIALGKTSVSDQGIGRLRWFGLPVRPCSHW